ncbi:hypothetical protein AIOL_000686 [Candidatus Rhodobacter oscarellae]|uniref:Sulfotransferase family protein n=1 Tax=Candidatus Rhodobacter oscarellae TaxID=1675527 RepID=A0A0J9ECS6_9RHOB|nr:hypothetical protein [Candidatus Rhodobacter lobularis]KMW60530.1 hypothetical protein AIOL_000686 [Candidatus Rhodobacter lobularis]
MTRVIIHAGFHKTGTTSLQSFLKANRARLAPHAAIYMGQQLGEARRLGRIYGERPLPWRRWAFRRGLTAFLNDVPDAPVILISRESLSGAMLGASRFGRPATRYAPVAIRLAKEILGAVRGRFGSEAQVEFLYTIRERDNFLRSVWGHQLRTKPLTEDLATFTARFADGFDLRREAEKIAKAVAPAQTHIRALEETSGDALGPGRFVLDLLGLAEDGMFVPPPDRHAGASDALCAELLELNRSRPAGSALRQKKEALWKAEQGARRE